VSAVADKYPVLQELGVEVISVSVDSHFVHKMWNDYELSKMVKGGIPFHMASDQAGNVGRAYGVWDENQGIELRGRFIIDPIASSRLWRYSHLPLAGDLQNQCVRFKPSSLCAHLGAKKLPQRAGNRASQP
jgi:alkyl hydroperoxide reductase subunit AhpC